MALFGDGAKYLNYVDCNDSRALCAEKNIRYYPTWINGKRRLEDNIPLEALAVWTGCD